MNLQKNQSLPLGENLLWFKLIKVLGQGGFGITYLAEDLNLKKIVAIKEYFPNHFASRDNGLYVKPNSGKEDLFSTYRKKFWEEAQTLASFSHPNIVRVRTAFEFYNTVYMVMDYEQGLLLNEFLGSDKLSEKELLNLMIPIFDGLSKVHQRGFIHRDIKPENIIVRDSGTPVLLDFGSARISAPYQTYQDVTVMVSPGYAPIEQFSDRLELQGPWTDIYALAAVMHFCIVGKPPIDSQQRYIPGTPYKKSDDPFIGLCALKPKFFSSKVLKAIDDGLVFHGKNRPQSMLAWKKKFIKTDLYPQGLGILQAQEHKLSQIPYDVMGEKQLFHPLAVIDTPKNQSRSQSSKKRHFLQSLSISLSVLGLIVLTVVAILRGKEGDQQEKLLMMGNPINSTAAFVDVQEPVNRWRSSPVAAADHPFYGPETFELNRKEVALLVRKFKQAFEKLETEELMSMTIMTWDKHMLLNELTRAYSQTSLRWGDFQINHSLTEGYAEFVIVKLINDRGDVYHVPPATDWARVRLVVRKHGEGQLVAKW